MKEWVELKKILEAIREAGKNLVSVIGNLRKTIMERDIEGLELLIEEQESIKRHIALLEKQRANLCRIISEHYIGRQDLLFPDLLEYVPAAMQAEFISLHRELKELLAKIKRETRINRYVLNTILKYISDQIDIYTSTDGIIYNSSGTKKTQKRSLFFGKA